MRLPRAPHPRVTCGRNIKISDKTRDRLRQLMCKASFGYEAGPYNQSPSNTDGQETALKLPFMMEQLSHQEVLPNVFGNETEDFEGR